VPGMKLHRISEPPAARSPRAAAVSAPSAGPRWWSKKSPTWAGAALLLAAGCGGNESSVTGWPTLPLDGSAAADPGAPPQGSTGGDGADAGGGGGGWASTGGGSGSSGSGSSSGNGGASSGGGSGAGTSSPGGDGSDGGWTATDSGAAGDDASTGTAPWPDA